MTNWVLLLFSVSLFCQVAFSFSFSLFGFFESSSDAGNSTIECVQYEQSYVCKSHNLTHFPELSSDVVSVTLDDNLLTSISLPPKLSSLKFLSVAKNRIVSLQMSPFVLSGSKIESLNLSGNAINEISGKYFRNLRSLKVLDLSSNQLVELQPSTFAEIFLPQVKYIRLESNELVAFSDDCFSSLKSLNYLSLRSNSLTRLNFSHPSSLQLLDVSSNQLQQLNVIVLQGLSELQGLLLSFNRLSDLGAILQPLTKLTSLDLSFNRFTRLNAAWFQGTVLESLNLDGNLFTVMDRPIVPRSVAISLRNLSISSTSSLTRIRTRVFSNLWYLQKLRIQENVHLQKLDEGFLDALLKPELLRLTVSNNSLFMARSGWAEIALYASVDLSGNPWNCSCYLQWLADQCNLRADRCAAVGNSSVFCSDQRTALGSLNTTACDYDDLNSLLSRRWRGSRAFQVVAIVVSVFTVLVFAFLFYWFVLRRKMGSCSFVYQSRWGTKGNTAGYRYSEVQESVKSKTDSDVTTHPDDQVAV